MVLHGAKSAELVALRLADPSVREAMFARAPKRGRGKAPSVALDPQTSMVMRRYRHGGLFGWLTGPLFLGPGRPLNELRVNARAEASGAPVPRVLCLVLWPEFGPFWSAVIGTQEERLARELQDVLLASPAPLRVALSRSTGTAIRRLHDSGVEHRDLQLRNILVAENGGPRIVVVDLDRAQFHRYGLVPIAGRARNLGRLARSAVKLGLWGGAVGRRELAAFAGAYAAGNRTLRRELRARIPVERLKLLAHRVTYPLRGAATHNPGSGSDRPGPAPGS
jgi:3-deoxy-D-manno-octulosonic acid kinase